MITNERLGLLKKRLTEKYGNPIGTGRHRQVWDTGKGHVIKIPKTWEVVGSNVQEFERYKTSQGIDRKRLAKCRLLMMDGDIPVIIMERVLRVGDCCWHDNQGGTETTIKGKALPDWVEELDGPQVGYDRRGKLRAFDYGAL